ncbi:MAG: PqqD family protein [Candidatus Eremiobacteraeota bacterium]|nr:PqqD family protein [Candidatus Eremiobacteraeota bacterium]
MQYRINAPRILAETVGDETLIIDTLTGLYFCTRATGALVWRWLEQGVSVETIVTRLADLPGAPAGEIQSMVDALILALLADELIVQDDSPKEEPAAEIPPGMSFSPPSLERFSDMEKLLVVDPLHDLGPEENLANSENN